MSPKPKNRVRMWIIPLTAAFAVGLIGWWAITSVSSAMRATLKKDLQTNLSADVTALRKWIESQEKICKLLNRDSTLNLLIGDLTQRTSGMDVSSKFLSNLPLQSRIRGYLTNRLEAIGYSGYAIIGKEGFILGAQSDGLLGQRILTQNLTKLNKLFETGDSQLITPFKSTVQPGSENQLEVTVMVVASPVFNEEGQILAAMGLVLSPEDDFTPILSVSRFGRTGETFAFDIRGNMISQSRFDSQLKAVGLLEDLPEIDSVLNVQIRNPGGDLLGDYKTDTPRRTQPLTRMAASAVRGESGVDVEGYRDYRGVKVVGAWQWLTEYGFGVATKIDSQEAFRTLIVLAEIILILFALLVICTICMVAFSYFAIDMRRRVQKAETEIQELGQYTLEEKIGEGGMGTVYRARHALLRRPTAIKLLQPEKSNKDSIARFEREVQFSSQLCHPNTIQIFDYGHTPEGLFYYVMEYLEGVNLRTLVNIDGPQPEGRIIYILSQVCASLSEAHDLGLVHRDIKPANIIITDRGGVKDQVKVLDFGLVKNISGQGEPEYDLTKDGSVTGTPHYMSPEIILNSQGIDARSDIYALGALAYYLLTGHEVFIGQSSIAICRHHINTPAERPSKRFKKNICPVFEEVLMKCLEKNPDNRPSSTRELADALKKSPKTSTWDSERAGNWWRNHATEAETRVSARSMTTPVDINPTLKINLEERSVLQ